MEPPAISSLCDFILFFSPFLIDIAGHLWGIVSFSGFLITNRGSKNSFITRMDCIYLGQKVRPIFMCISNFSLMVFPVRETFGERHLCKAKLPQLRALQQCLVI